MIGGVARRTRVVGAVRVYVVTRTGAGVVTEIAHTSALPNGTVGQSDTEELDAAVGARAGVVAIVAAMGAPPRHFGSDAE